LPISPLGASSNATTAAATASKEAGNAVEAGRNDRDSKVLSNIVVASNANESNPEGSPKTVVKEELALARNRMKGVTPDENELVAGANRRLLVEQGKAEEARRAYDDAKNTADKLTAELTRTQEAKKKADQDLELAIQTQKRIQEEYDEKIKQNQIEAKAYLDKIEQDHKDELARRDSQVLKEQVTWFNRAGAGCITGAVGLAAAAWLVGGIVSIRKAAPIVVGLALLSVCAFSMAQLLGQPWIKWVGISILGAVVIACTVWGVQMAKKNKLESELKEKAESLSTIVHNTVPVLDTAWETVVAQGNKMGQDLLETLVFAPLRAKNDPEKKLIKKVRAGNLKVESTK
jgi:hypothetical protein